MIYNPWYNTDIAFEIRDNGVDTLVVDEVWQHDEYRLSDPSVYTQKGCVIDIGANIGTFSVRAAKAFNRQVYSYEPEQNNYNLLVSNVNRMGLFNVATFKLAVSDDRNGMYLENRGGNSGSYKSDVIGTEFVESTTLEDILRSHGHCFYLKIDIEGAEVDAINAAPPNVFDDVDYIAMEYHGQTPEWGDMVRKLSGRFDLEIRGHPAPDHVYGGMIFGKAKNV